MVCMCGIKSIVSMCAIKPIVALFPGLKRRIEGPFHHLLFGPRLIDSVWSYVKCMVSMFNGKVRYYVS